MKSRSLNIGVLLCLFVTTTVRAADAPLTRCGLLLDQTVANDPAAAIFEASFPQEHGVIALDRTDIDKVLDEQKLQAMFSPDGVSQRSALGKIVKADLLIMIRRGPEQAIVPGTPKPSPSIEIVVSETHRGLRLVTETLPTNGAAVADAQQLIAAFHRALDRNREPLRTIVAVPPFASLNLTHDQDYLQDVYVRLVQEVLSRQPGVLVVEIAEAKALADEIILAGGDPIRRETPFYVTGQFRHEGVGTDLHVALTIDLTHAGKQLDRAAFDHLSPVNAPETLRSAALSLLKTMGHSAKAPANEDVSIEATELASEAENFSRVGDWHEARTLAEAALLLDPKNARMHGVAYQALNALAIQAGGTPGELRVKDAKKALAYFYESLSHLEPFIVGTTFAPNIAGSTQDFYLGGYWNTVRTELLGKSPDQRWLDADRDARQAVLNALHRKADAKIDDQTAELFFSLITPVVPDPSKVFMPEQFPDEAAAIAEKSRDLRLSLLKEFSYRRHAATFIHLMLQGCPVETSDPQWQAFFAEVNKIPNPEIAPVWAELTDQYYRARVRAKPQPATQPIANPADAEIVFAKLEFQGPSVVAQATVTNELIGGLPAGDGVDVFWTSSRVFTMKQKGVLANCWDGKSPPMAEGKPDGIVLTPTGACFDGQYVWFTTATGLDRESRLMAIDVAQSNIVWLGKAHGLPPGAHVITALAPGKVCVGGELPKVGADFGRAWCAVASVKSDLAGQVPLKVIYEAREVPPKTSTGDGASADNVAKAWPILEISALADRPAITPATNPAASVLPRVLVRRLGQQYFLLDPNNGKVAKVPCPMVVADAAWVDRGTIYWRGYSKELGAPSMSRSVGPELTVDAHPWRIPNGDFFTDQNGTCFLIDHKTAAWLVSRDGTPPFRKLHGEPMKDLRFSRVCRSTHYGLLVFNSLKHEVIGVTFPKPLPEAKPSK